MGVLSDREIKRRVGAGDLLIEPFDETLIQPASYDLRLGSKLLASPLSPTVLGAKIELDKNLPSYAIQSGQMVSVLSEEILRLPLDLCASFGIRSAFSRRGIDDFGGLQLDPGWKGRLLLNLLNVGPEAVTITRGDPFFSVEFRSLNEPAEKGYDGPYQNQEDFPDEQYEFITSARTTSLAEIPALRQAVSHLSVLVEELDEKLPDLDDVFELKDEVIERLHRSLEIPKDSLISIEEMRAKLNR